MTDAEEKAYIDGFMTALKTMDQAADIFQSIGEPILGLLVRSFSLTIADAAKKKTKETMRRSVENNR